MTTMSKKKINMTDIIKKMNEEKINDRHYKYGELPKDNEIELKYAIIKGVKYNFISGYIVNIRDGEIKSNYSNFGKNEHPVLRYKEEKKTESGHIVNIRDGIKMKPFTKSHLIFAAFQPDVNIDTIDHIDGNHSNNEIFNLDPVSRKENNLRAHNLNGNTAAVKSGKTRCKPVLQKDRVTDRIIKRFESVKNAAETLGINRNNLGEAARGNRPAAGGYAWEYVREIRDEIEGYPRLEQEYRSLSDTRKNLIKKYLNNKRCTPPKKVSNYGEIMDNHDRWNIGTVHRNGKCSVANEMLVHVWIMFYFHKSDKDIQKWISDENFQILHKNGNKNDSNKYHIHTHIGNNPNNPYTNYFWTLRFGTRKENRNDYITSEQGITKDKLKTKCRDKGLKVGGNRKELLKRLDNPTKQDINGSENNGYVKQRESGRWEARKSREGKDTYLGTWGSKEEAQQAIDIFVRTGTKLHLLCTNSG